MISLRRLSSKHHSAAIAQITARALTTAAPNVEIPKPRQTKLLIDGKVSG